MLDGGVAGQRSGRQFAGLGDRFENASVWTVFLEQHFDFVAAGRLKFHSNLVGLIRQIAVGVLHANVNRVAGLDLIGRTILRNALVGGRPRLALQHFAEGFLFLIDDLAARNFELGVRGNVDLGVRQRHIAELGLEGVRVIAANHVLAGKLQRAVVLHNLPQPRIQVGPEQSLASLAA